MTNYWYAITYDVNTSDFSVGSYSLAVAKRMALKRGDDILIAVISESDSKKTCVRVISRCEFNVTLDMRFSDDDAAWILVNFGCLTFADELLCEMLNISGVFGNFRALYESCSSGWGYDIYDVSQMLGESLSGVIDYSKI